MFEQTIVTDGEKRPWTYFVAASGQMLLATVFVMLPLIYTDSIGLRSPAPPALIFKPAPAPIPVTVEASATTAPTTSFLQRVADRVFQAPTTIPTTLPTFPDEPGPSIAQTSSGPHVPGWPAEGVPGNFVSGTGVPPPYKRDPPVAQKTPLPAGPIAVGGSVQAAKLIKKVVPEYPALGRQVRVSGTVRLLGIIGKDGTIQKLELVSGHPLLAPAALNAVRQWVYQPTLLNGQPVEVQAPIDVIFTLGQ